MRMSRKKAVTEWTKKAIEKYYLGFVIPDRISEYYDDYEPFYYAHGLEVLCKAYVIGKRHPEYKNMPFSKAKSVIDNIAKEYKHNLFRLLRALIDYNALPTGFMAATHHHSNINNVDITNEDILKTLSALYIEARYPVVELDYKRHYLEKVKDNPKATNKRYPEIPKLSHQIERFSREMFLLIITKIEREFMLKELRHKLCEDIDNNDWARFSNLFFNAG